MTTDGFRFTAVLSTHVREGSRSGARSAVGVRSPSDVLRDEAVAAAGLSGAVRVDSAGVSDEEHGNPIDPRAARVLRAHGHGVPDHRARQVRADELADWDLVLAMTSSHYAALSRLRDRARPGGRAPEIRMFRDFDPQCAHLPEGPGRDKDLPDPWYGDYGDFVDTLAVIERSTPALVDYVRP